MLWNVSATGKFSSLIAFLLRYQYNSSKFELMSFVLWPSFIQDWSILTTNEFWVNKWTAVMGEIWSKINWGWKSFREDCICWGNNSSKSFERCVIAFWDLWIFFGSLKWVGWSDLCTHPDGNIFKFLQEVLWLLS